MAALSSTQSGNFNSASTWGGTAPSDGDTFTINRGHKVTVNSDLRPTNGYGDIVVYGNLHLTTNGKFRINGRITVKGNDSYAYNTGTQFAEGNTTNSGGLLSSDGNNMILEVRGNNADQHGIWIENERFASMQLDADAKRSKTALSSNLLVNADYIPVSNASLFSAGDWIAVYRDDHQDNRVRGDEGFWVHDVDTANNRLYYRQFVCPSSEITSISGTTVYVENAKVFRKGYKIICGTGSSRKVATINDINYAQNKLTMSASFVSGNVGQIMYQTGAEKKHLSGDAVEKIATTLTTEVSTSDSTNQITVGSAADIAVGDTIVIDVNNDVRGWDFDSEYVVTAKSGNTLTLDDQVRHIHFAGSVVQILNRNFTIKGVDTSSDTRPFLYVEYWTDYSNAHTRNIRVKDVRFTNWGGNTGSTYYRGFMIAGYNSEFRDNESTDNRYDFQSCIQGVVIDNCNYKTSYTGLSTRHPHGLVVRNCCVYNIGGYNYFNWSSTHNLKWYNNYATRSDYTTFYNDAMYEPYNEWAYNYYTRSDDYGMLFHQNRDAASAVRHHIVINHEQRYFYTYYNQPGSVYERMYFDGYAANIPLSGMSSGPLKWLDCYFGNRATKNIFTDEPGKIWANDYLVYGGDDGRARWDRTTGKSMYQISYEHNFMYDTVAEAWGAHWRYKNSESGDSWFMVGGDTSYPFFADQVYVPANTTVRLSCELKTPSIGSYSYPLMFARTHYGGYSRGRWETDYTGQDSTVSSNESVSNLVGWEEVIYWDSGSQDSFQEKQLTIQPQDRGYFLVYGVACASTNNRQEIFHMRDVNVLFDTAPGIRPKDTNNGKGIQVRSSFNSGKKRIGGTRL
jgi:hypothetical protein